MLCRDRYADAGILCKKAAEAWTDAAANGYRKGGTYVKASMVMLERSTAAQMMVLEQKNMQETKGGKRGGSAKKRGAKMEQEVEVREEEKVESRNEEEERFRKAVEEEVKARVSVELKKLVERAVKAKLGAQKKLEEERAEKERKEAADATAAAAAAVRDEMQRAKSRKNVLADLEEARQREKKWVEEQDKAERERRER